VISFIRHEERGKTKENRAPYTYAVCVPLCSAVEEVFQELRTVGG